MVFHKMLRMSFHFIICSIFISQYLIGTEHQAFKKFQEAPFKKNVKKQVDQSEILKKQVDHSEIVKKAHNHCQPGCVGPTGPRGPTGAKGVDGCKGKRGPRGHRGHTGATGATGPLAPGNSLSAYSFAVVEDQPLAAPGSTAVEFNHILETTGTIVLNPDDVTFTIPAGRFQMGWTLTFTTAVDLDATLRIDPTFTPPSTFIPPSSSTLLFSGFSSDTLYGGDQRSISGTTIVNFATPVNFVLFVRLTGNDATINERTIWFNQIND